MRVHSPNESGQVLLMTIIILLVLSFLGYLAIAYGGSSARMAFRQSAQDTANQLSSLAVQDAIQWGNTHIAFPPGIPSTQPSYFFNQSCSNGGIGCSTPFSASQVAASSPIWNTAATVSNQVVAPLASSLPGATVKWVMEYYGSGLCTVSGCSSDKAPTNVCRCYYYRITALATNDPNHPNAGISAVTQTLFKIPQPR